nr:MAG TPA: Halobacterial output domain 2 [Caudoviricetes sp.]DAQ42531.1 MAG TPA: Halobacterial output domain 2 [Caudoviricetes sp.]
MNVLTWFRQHYCRHSYRKHWNRDSGPYGGYVRRCTKCNRIEQ